MPSLNVIFQHVRVLMKNGRIRNATIISRTSATDVMVRIHRTGTPFRATLQSRTRNGKITNILTEF